MIQRETSNEIYKEKRIFENKICRKKKKSLVKKTNTGNCFIKNTKEKKKLYKEISFQTKSLQPKVNGCRSKDGRLLGEEKLVMVWWTDYFRGLLTENESEELNFEFNYGDDKETFDEDLTPIREEIDNCINRMKNNKASWTEKINPKFIKYWGNTAFKIISEVIKKVWIT